MLVYEFRIVLPMLLAEYQTAQLYTTVQFSKGETGGGDGVEILINRPIEKPRPIRVGFGYAVANQLAGEGQYTEKVYHIKSKAPNILKVLAPTGSMVLYEKSWNYFPKTVTVLSNEYMKGDFFHVYETISLADDDGTTDNAFNLDLDRLKEREVIKIDIVNDKVDPKDYIEEDDPAKCSSIKTGRGPLGNDWKTSLSHKMCVYKLVTTRFKWPPLGGTIENMIMEFMRRMILNFHRKLFCLTDQWLYLSMTDIRAIEEFAKHDLDDMRNTSNVMGMHGK